MITFEEYKVKFHSFKDLKEYYGDDVENFIQTSYRDYLYLNLRNILRSFEYKRGENTTTEELYNWCITLETIFNIKTERNGLT